MNKNGIRKRIEEIEINNADEIEMYKFIQFVISKQNEETREFAQKHDIKMIADRQVAFSDRDTWAYQSLFLKGWCLGCPPDYFSKDGQAWGFPVMDPERLYNADGSLDEGGLLLKNLYKKMFRENPGGVRIDHIVGLIDPWVYKSGKNLKLSRVRADCILLRNIQNFQNMQLQKLKIWIWSLPLTKKKELRL